MYVPSSRKLTHHMRKQNGMYHSNLFSSVALSGQMTVAAKTAMAMSVTASKAKMPSHRATCPHYESASSCRAWEKAFDAYGSDAYRSPIARDCNRDRRRNCPCERNGECGKEYPSLLLRHAAQRPHILYREVGDEQSRGALDQSEGENVEDIARIVELAR